MVVCFGLFTRIGGAGAALATLLGGVASYVAALTVGAPYPFLTSLVTSLLAYGAAMAVEHGRRAFGAAARS